MIYIVFWEYLTCVWKYESFRTKREAVAFIDSLKDRGHDEDIELMSHPTPKNKAEMIELLNIVCSWVISN